ncbi:Calcium-binding protein 39-like [Seminavis robusta]|uniref:Calcium-binding protein 39-like n=1 Tax=Seminavis robusta TaxID=568900 RepID=A0A9N8DRS9_9STRA|nr:Calcium-binding protein 39-like [Seminavis robusta]|eukprot:Sro294_g110290.1 Calcium-binding protein 39-like (405) ;mRNA; f:61336-62550
MTSENKGPFEWLSGGLIFGKKGGIEGVDSCKDVGALITGMDENLKEICLQQESSAEAAKFLEARSSRLRFLLYEERRITSSQESRRSSPAVAGATVGALTGDSMSHLVPRLLDNLGALPFESRKHVASIVNYLLVCGLEGSDGHLYQPLMNSFRDYVASRYDEIISTLVKGHDCELHGGQADCSLHFGSMLRSCLRHVALYQQLTITTERTQRFVFPFLDKYVHLPNFDVSSDAMETLRIIFTGSSSSGATAHQHDEQTQQAMAEIAANFLTRDYDAIWVQRFPLLLTETANYMTRRMALQILSTVLLTRSNYAVMIKYVAERRNLVLVMKLLRDTSPHITLDAFHVFKVFVANPNKPPEIIKILKDNKEKLCRYLETLHKDREEADTQFRDEKALIIATIEGL